MKELDVYSIICNINSILYIGSILRLHLSQMKWQKTMHKSSGFIPGIRPGEETAIYFERVLNRLSFIGGIFAAIISCYSNNNRKLYCSLKEYTLEELHY